MNYSVAFGILIDVLQGKKNSTELAQKFEISSRTVKRYIDNLCMAGIPIISKQGRYGGFEVQSNFKLRDYFLTRSEKKYVVDLLEKQDNFDAKILALKIKAIGTL